MKLKERAKSLKTDVPAVFIAMKSGSTPALAKILAVITVCYALSPVDLIPDFIPVLGYLDDLVVLPALIAVTVKLVPHDVWTDCKKQAENMWLNGKPKKWYYALPVVAFWLVMAGAVAKVIYGICTA